MELADFCCISDQAMEDQLFFSIILFYFYFLRVCVGGGVCVCWESN